MSYNSVYDRDLVKTARQVFCVRSFKAQCPPSCSPCGRHHAPYGKYEGLQDAFYKKHRPGAVVPTRDVAEHWFCEDNLQLLEISSKRPVWVQRAQAMDQWYVALFEVLLLTLCSIVDVPVMCDRGLLSLLSTGLQQGVPTPPPSLSNSLLCLQQKAVLCLLTACLGPSTARAKLLAGTCLSGSAWHPWCDRMASKAQHIPVHAKPTSGQQHLGVCSRKVAWQQSTVGTRLCKQAHSLKSQCAY